MDKILNPDFGLIFWTWITFGILVFVLSKVAWKPILTSMRERELRIKNDLDSAKQSQKEAEALKASFETQMAAAQKQIQDLMAQARSDAEKSRLQMLETAKHEADRLLEKGRKDLAGETEKLKAELQKEVASLSVLIAEKIMHRSVDSKIQSEILNESLKSLQGAGR